MATPSEQAAPPPAGQPPAAEAQKGYFATLGVTFRADDATIGKAYKKLALKMHPDKNPGPSAVDQFQKITTSYHVILDDQKRKNYLRLFSLRCYMSQVCPQEGDGLRPHYAFMVEKSKFALGGKSDRLITLDLLDRKMQSFKKDSLKKEFSLSALTGVDANEKKLELTVSFKDNHAYYITTRCQIQFETLLTVLRRIIAASAGGGELTDESLQLMCDDSEAPVASVHKSKVIKRAERSVGSSLVADWQPRYMVMGATHLIIFRDMELQQMVNVVPLSMIKFIGDSRDRTNFQLTTSYWRASFRVLTEEIASKWGTILAEQQEAERDMMADLRQLPESERSSRSARSRPKTRDMRPSVIFSETDLTNMHRPAPKMESAPSGFFGMRKMGSSLHPALEPTREESLAALPPPQLARGESELGSWIKYRDDEGRAYYYNRQTGQTSWSVPEGFEDDEDGEAGSGAGLPPLPESSSNLALPQQQEGDKERQAQMAALQESDAPYSEEEFAQAKGALLGLMQNMERGLLKARRGVEADKSLKDLAPMFDQLKVTFAKMSEQGGQFERTAMARDEAQRSFMSNKSAYLSGLQAHVLGEEVAGDTVADKIFKKGAYVADTFNKMTNMRGVL